MRILLMIVSFALLLFVSCGKSKQSKVNGDVRWSVKMADAAMVRCDSLMWCNDDRKHKWQYDVAMLGQAIDKLGYIDTIYSKYHEDYLNYFIRDSIIIKYKLKDYNLDNVNPAKGLITLYKRTGEEKYLNAINIIVRQLEQQPRTRSGGFWHKAKYPYQMWLDGIYMSSPFLAQYANEFNKPAWFDTVAFQIMHIYEKTCDPETGLLYHAWDESREQAWCDPETGRSKEFWGRAMGWYMMALVDVLGYLPNDHPKRDSIIAILVNTSEALLRVRDPETGLWYQVLNKGGQEGNYLEASCSSMFTYAFAKGAKMDYLPVKYQKIAEESFQALIDNFIITGDNGLPVMTGICAAAGLGGNPYRDGSYEYYVNEQKRDDDTKGVGPFIMAAIELNR
ncbi:MAG: glycoside hydrolase family 88 protein [Bacteroidales bacterium]|nr:glycoside hydrolase family 88 protein [Bacteroidales bacterium]MBN2762554.1 glycoside hydrolase family 88 protein [Bacteroidales bacterium]